MQEEQFTQILNKHFSIEELQTLFFKLDLDYSETTAKSKGQVTEMLLSKLGESDSHDKLQLILEKERPHLFGIASTPEKSQVFPIPQSKAAFQQLSRVELFHLMTSHLTFSQVQVIAFEMMVDDKQFISATLLGHVRDLIVEIDKRGELPLLRNHLSTVFADKKFKSKQDTTRTPKRSAPRNLFAKIKSKFNAQPAASKASHPTPSPNFPPFEAAIVEGELSLAEQIQQYFSIAEFRTLCFDLNVDWEMLKGADHLATINNFLSHCQQHDQTEDLRLLIKNERPFVSWADA